MKNPVYTYVEQVRMPSSHGKDFNYIVCYASKAAAEKRAQDIIVLLLAGF